MSLALVGVNASYEFRWRRWALLRDVVVTHLDDPKSASRYPHFTSIGNALGVEFLRLRAEPLAREMHEMRAELAKRSLDDLVLGPVTAKVLYPNIDIAVARPLTRTERSHVAPVGTDETLDQYFASMIDSILEVCAHPDSDGTIEVHDG
jgi:hypothetical protein